jgi:uncharacterized protein (TIGR02145 family)
MKNNFFRNTAPVIPTGAKRSGGISRLTHNTTIKAGAHMSRFLGKLGMTVLLYSPVVLSAQNGVTISNLAVNSGTVTLDVSWNRNATELKNIVWLDSVWVFVDYNKGGVMERLPLGAGATLTYTSAPGVGRVIQYPDNNKGVWVVGNAKSKDNSSGSFSATVRLLTTVKDVAGACAYASNYPLVGEYIATEIAKFTGTPPYNLVLKNAGNDTIYRTSGADFDIPEGYALISFTDATGAPGIMKCIAPATYTLSASASSFCAGSEGVTFALSGTESGRDYQLYRDNSAVDDAVLNGTGNAATFTGSFDDAGTYTALSIADDLHCAIAMSGTLVVIENPLPADPIVNNAKRDCPGTITLSASSPDAVIDWYADATATLTLHTGESYTTPEIFASTTYYVQAQSAAGCLSARVAVVAEVDMDGCCDALGTTGIAFSAFNGCPVLNGTWTLTDDRDQKMYKVKYMADGRYWMVQDLKFGNCSSNTFVNSNSNSAARATPTVAIDYVGHCHTNYRSDGGYLYDWPAVMNNPQAYFGSPDSSFACKGTEINVNACQGICPENWHVPTKQEFEDAFDKFKDAYNCQYYDCFDSNSQWEGVAGGQYLPGGSYDWTGKFLYQTSTYDYNNCNHVLCNTYTNYLVTGHYKNYARALRCVRNY